MKRPISFLLFLFSICNLSAAPPVFEMPIASVGTTQTIALSTSAWTQLSSTTGGNLAGRTGIYVVNYSSNTNSVGLTYSVAEPTTVISERDIELEPGEWDVLPVSKGIELWGVYYGSAAERIQVK